MKSLFLLLMLLLAQSAYAQDDKNEVGGEIVNSQSKYPKNESEKDDFQQGVSSPKTGWVNGDDTHVLLDPDSKTYGFRFSGEARDWVHFAIGANYTFVGLHQLLFYTGIGPGGRYEFNPFLVFINAYPYIGFSGADKINKETGKTTSETKYDFSYGAMGTIGIGLKLFETSKNKRWYLSGGYTISAAKFKTKGMFDNGIWLVGLTVVE